MISNWIGNLSERGVRILALSLIVLLFASPVVTLLWLTAVPGHTYVGALKPLLPSEAILSARLKGHVTAIASEPHNVRHPEALERSAAYIERALMDMGYTVRRQVFDSADQHYVRNIEVVIEAANKDAPTLVIGAHYDSYGEAPGADDNGSGTAAVIELARSLADLRGKSPYRLRLVLFVNEEPPFFKTDKMGSLVYARWLAQSGEPVAGMLSLETIGFYSDRQDSQHYPTPLDLLYPTKGDFVAFVGTTSSRGLVRKTVESFRQNAQFPSVGGTAPGFVQGLDWSDHWSFNQNGIPALMVTDTAPFRYPHYHSTADTPDKVDYDRLARVVAGLERTIRTW